MVQIIYCSLKYDTLEAEYRTADREGYEDGRSLFPLSRRGPAESGRNRRSGGKDLMPRGVCSVCSRSDAGQIDDDLSKGAWTLRDLSARWGIPRSSLHYHKQKHMRARLRKAADERAGGSDPQLLDRVLELNKVALSILSKAYGAGNYSAAVAAVRESRENLKLQAQLLGVLREGGTTVNIMGVIDVEAGRRMAEIYLERHKAGPTGGQVPSSDLVIEASIADEQRQDEHE